MRVADYLIRRLVTAGAQHVFMLPGGAAMYLNDAVGRTPELTPVCNLHEQACAIAAENAENLNLTARATFIQSDWMVGIEGKFDIIVSNPPYIVESDIPTLEADVSLFEPHLALSGGPDGLDAYRLIADQAAAHLSPQGLLAVEIGMGQVTDIKELFEQNGFKIKNIHKDFSHV